MTTANRHGPIRTLTFLLVALCPTGIGAQAPATSAFDVASVKANRSGAPLQILPTLQPGGRVFAINLPLREFIQVAYGLRNNQLVFASPLAGARFDLEARAGAGATSEQAAAMLRALLIDRFGLRTHSETRQLPVYALERVNVTRLGPEIKPSGTECAVPISPSGPGLPPPPPPPPAGLSGARLGPRADGAACPSMFFPGAWSMRSMSLHAFALALERLVQRPVVDRTGLTGGFDFDLTYVPEAFEFPFPAGVAGGAVGGPVDGPAATAVPAQRPGPSVFTALRDQLGLRLENDRAPIDVVVVDDVRQPREN